MTKPLTLTHKPVIVATKPQRPQAPHKCKAADRYICLSKQHTTPDLPVSVDLARCLNGCPCRCHTEKNGAEIAVEVWAHLYGGEL
jgi:hypothetical protein